MHASRGGWGVGLALWSSGSMACGGSGDTTDTTANTTGGTATATATTAPDVPTSSDTTSPGNTGTSDTPTGPDPGTTTDTTDTTAPPATTGETTDDPSTGGSLASCDDGQKNQDETAVDCGGACDPCPDGAACFADADCTAGTCDDLMCGAKRYGVWGLGLIGNKTAYDNFLPAIHGYHFRFSWADYEPTAGGFVGSYVKDDVTTVVVDNLHVGFMMVVAPTSSGNTPDWLFANPHDVPLVQTSTMQTFPHYFDAIYQQRYFGMLDALRAEVAGWDQDLRSAVLFWQSAEGSTGDEGPYKGDPPQQYAISDDEWTAFKRDDVWTPMYSDISADLPTARFMVNQGNDGTNFQWALDNLPGAWLKAGQFTHFYNFSGEGPYAARLQALRDSPPDEHRVRGENEGTTEAPWWMESPAKNTFALACSCLHAGVDILNISPTNALTDHTAYEFFNKYAGIRRPEHGNVGFAALRDMIDLADTVRFPEAEFGPLVAPADKQLYDNRVDLIKNSGDPLALQESRLTKLLLSGKMGQPFLNAARITEIVAAFPDANYTSITEDDVDSYNMDFGVHMIPGNYALFVTQQDPHATSVGVYRQGPMNDSFGRFGRRFASADGKDRMTFAVDPALLGDATYSVRVLVTALDDGAGEWSLRYWDGSAEQTADTVTNTDTGASITHVFEIPALVAGGHLPASGDLALQHEAGADTTFFVVEVERRAQLSD